MNIKRNLSKAAVLAVGATMLMATPAMAKEGPEDWYDTYESQTRYEVGDDIDPGMYVFFNKNDTRNASITIKRDGDNIWSESFWNNYIVDLQDGDIVSAVGTYCVEYDEVEDFSMVSSEEGFFEVGKHIMPGTYDVQYVRGEDGEGFIRVWQELVYADNADYKDYQTDKSISRGSEVEVDLEEGWFVELNACRLVYQD